MRSGLSIIFPAIALAVYMVGAFLIYCVRCGTGQPPDVGDINARKGMFTPFFARYFMWLVRPFEQACLSLRISPDALTAACLLVSAASGVALATHHLATAGWLYIAAGALDVLDGRIARATGKTSEAGALLDSVADRWGEIFVFLGIAFHLRESPWMIVAVIAICSSLMVSYTRARGESLGVHLDEGIMQRAERMALLSVGMLAAAFALQLRPALVLDDHVLGSAVLLVALGASFTAVYRWTVGYQLLRARNTPAPARHVVQPGPAPEVRALHR